MIHTALLLFAAASQPLPVGWSVAPAGSDRTRVQLTLELRQDGDRSLRSAPIARTELGGLVDDGPVRFVLRRPAGMLDCTGRSTRGRGEGTCGFTPDPAFADALAGRGIGRPSARQAYHLAIHGVGLDLVDLLGRQGYARPTIDELVAAGVHGVSVAYVSALGGAGYRVGRLDRLVAFRIHGVSAGWIARLAAANPRLARLPADELIAMRIHGVSPDWVGEIARLGYDRTSGGELVAMRIHGVSPGFIRAAQARTGRRPTVEELVAMRITGLRTPAVPPMRS